MNDDLTPRRREILEAAIVVLARDGLRGLTHRAVDREAGFPEGTSSAYFRSRHALQIALAAFVNNRLARDVQRLGARLATRPGDHEHSAAATSRLFVRWLDHPELLIARLELTVAATRDDALAQGFLDWRRDLVAVVAGLLDHRDRAGSPPLASTALSAENLVAALDGVLLAAMLEPASHRRAFARLGVDQLLSTLGPAH